LKEGIPINKEVVASLEDIARHTGVELFKN
jgi:hypothetical protein